MLETAAYASSTGSTTSESCRRVGGVGAGRRARVVRLVRPRRAPAAFGFSLRGGREHGAGFFITKVEHNSEAYRQGLKAGDQVVCVNGYRVDDAVHAELAHYISTQNRLKVKVRNVGMIPVKDKSHEPLTWRFVTDNVSISSDATTSSSPTLCAERPRDVHISILVPHKAKLGCGICAGPAWKPGIFVQFVRAAGIAADCGLRAGDQILSCNGVGFTNLHFHEAISVMRRSSRLELRVRPGAGAELVSPESSGYNSSASTHSDPAPAPRHLPSLSEEPGSRHRSPHRLSNARLKRHTWDSLDPDWRHATHSFDAPSDIEPDYDAPSIPDNPHSFDNHPARKFTTLPSNRTVINLTEDGATIQCSYDDKAKSAESATGCPAEKKTIVVEVHRGSSVNKAPATAPRTGETAQSETSSAASNATLSNAIAEEIQRRKLKKASNSSDPAVPQEQKKTALKPVDCEKQRQHDALMDEFKKVHKKMFAAQDESADCGALDRQQTLALRKSVTAAAPPPPAAPAAPAAPHTSSPSPPAPPPMPLPESDSKSTAAMKNGHAKPIENNGIIKGNLANASKLSQNGIVNNKSSFNQIMNGKPAINGLSNGNLQGNSKTSNGINGKIKVNENGKPVINGNLKRIPTPDYDTNTIEKLTSNLKLKSYTEDKVEVDSIDSFTMKNPASSIPKPPPNYFMRSPNGTATMKRTGRPVSITIGEYPSRDLRKEPSKLDFLNGEGKVNGDSEKVEAPIGSRLQSELAMTLSRSNLRRKTDQAKLDNNGNIPIDSNEESDKETDVNFHKRYANTVMPTPPPISIPKVPVVKTNSHPISQHIAMLAGRVAAANRGAEMANDGK